MADLGEIKGKITLDATGMEQGVKKSKDAMKDLGDEAVNTEKKTGGTGKTFLKAADQANTLALSAYVLYDSYDGVQSAQTASERAALKLSKANEAVEKAQSAYNEAVAKYGADSPQAIQASIDLAQANDAASIASQNADMAAGNLDDAWVSFALGGVSSTLGLISGAGGLVETLGGLSNVHFPKLGGAIKGIGSIFSSLGSMMMANPVMLILAAIAAIALIIITNWDAVKPFFEWLWNALVGIFQWAWGIIDEFVIQPLLAAWNLIKAGAEFMYNVLVAVWNGIVGALQWAWGLIDQYVIQPILKGWGMVSSFAAEMKQKLTDIWNGIYNTILGIWNWIDQNIVSPIKTAWDTIGKAAGDMKKVLEDVWNGIKSMIDRVVAEIMKIIGPFIDAAKWVIDNVGGVLDTVGGAVGDVVGGIGDFFGLSEGGVVRATPGGVPAILAEGGEDEYVIPASKIGRFAKAYLSSSMGSISSPSISPLPDIGGSYSNKNVVFNITSNDPKAVMREIYRQGKTTGLW